MWHVTVIYEEVIKRIKKIKKKRKLGDRVTEMKTLTWTSGISKAVNISKIFTTLNPLSIYYFKLRSE